MAKQHQSIATQMKTELEEPLAAFAGGMKERRKIVHGTIEKLLKTKMQQTHQVNKTRDKYEQECLKIKGYLAQGHMVMGQEERRNKAKLEKTQISLATSNSEYENAIKALEETTGRWNREWKAAADKFQDLEEERLDFTKSSLWTFANIASTVCVSDDASCEKVRLSLENMEVEKDIASFISESGTGQEIPDAPKYINFCRGDINDTQSEVSEDDHYSVAQFPRSINPAFRSSSPQPSMFETHHDPNSTLANNMMHRDAPQAPPSQKAQHHPRPSMDDQTRSRAAPAQSPYDMIQGVSAPVRQSMEDQQRPRAPPGQSPYDMISNAPLAAVPHDPYPMDGMTMLCRTGPPSDRGSHVNSARASSREDSHSDYSNPTSMSSVEPPSGKVSPTKQDHDMAGSPDKRVLKKKSGFFQNHSPFRRKSTKEVNRESSNSPTKQPMFGRGPSPEPIDANASLALGVGQNILPVTTADFRAGAHPVDVNDPIAAALAELKGVSLDKQGSVRMSADRYHGLATPGPGHQSAAAAGARGTPPPYQNANVSRLGVPPPAVTSKAMKQASQKVAHKTRSIFGEQDRDGGMSPHARPGSRAHDMPRSASPAPVRSASPQPPLNNDPRGNFRSVSPNPYAQQRNGSHHPRSGSDMGHYRQPSQHSRGASPASFREPSRPRSSYGGNDMSIQLAPAGDDMHSQRGRGMGAYDSASRPRSKSVVDPSRQYTPDGRQILHFGKFLERYGCLLYPY